MKVFISWSGDDSRKIADILARWLRMALQVVEPYVSTSILKGQRWAADLSAALEDSSVGIVVLTPSNTTSTWIHFESGALTKAVDQSRLMTLLCGLEPSGVRNPLAQFQATRFNKDDVFALLKSLNAAAGERALPESVLAEAYEALWPGLEQQLKPIIDSLGEDRPQAETKSEPEKSSAILEELLLLSRQQSQLLSAPERLFPTELIAAALREGQRSENYDFELLKMFATQVLRKWRLIEPMIEKVKAGEESAELEPAILEFGNILLRASEIKQVDHILPTNNFRNFLGQGSFKSDILKRYWISNLHLADKDDEKN